jgi:hypothetical protein
MTGLFRALFLFSSFGPLYLIFGVKLHFNTGVWWWAEWVAYAFAVASIGVFLYITHRLQRGNGRWIDITDVKSKDSEIFSYITTYIPPLISRDMSDPAVTVPLAILYCVIAVAYFRLDSPYLNPYFIFSGYRIYEGRSKSSRTMMTIISRRQPLNGSGEVMLREVGNGDLYYCESA